MKNKPKPRLKPLSLYPLKPEQALSAFMKIEPKKSKRIKKKKTNRRGENEQH